MIQLSLLVSRASNKCSGSNRGGKALTGLVMSIGTRDIKKLWGLSAGRCNYPSCNSAIYESLTGEQEVLGVMAHMVASSPDGPRGSNTSGDDSYNNRILLCPTHHDLVDKLPSRFPTDTLMDWKQRHEARVAQSLESPEFLSVKDMARFIQKLLVENRSVWKMFGPDSIEAKRNPVSNMADFWAYQKLVTIVPNNQLVANAIRVNGQLLDGDTYTIAFSFVIHAEAFELNCYETTEGVPCFPTAFQDWVEVKAA